jgi:hypothetical protein
MTLAELLKSKGIEDSIIEGIIADMKTNKIFTASEENLDVRYGKLKTDHDGKLKELTEAQNLIAELKKSSKGNEDLQGKISAYEQQVQQLQAELEQTKLDSAINVGLLAAGVKPDDVDYVTFKLKAKGDELALDENGKVKGWDDKVAALKTQLPGQFESAGSKKYEEHKLPDNQNDGASVNKEDFNKMGYQDRLKLFKENPEAYAELTK